MKPVIFMGRSLLAIRAFPKPARQAAGYQLDRIQHGLNPTDWKPIPSIGQGVREIRVREGGQFRVIYVASVASQIAILHAFRKKTAKTRRADLDTARRACKELRSRGTYAH